MKNLLTNNEVIDLTYELFQDHKKSFVGTSALMLLIVMVTWYMVFIVIYIVLIVLFIGLIGGLVSGVLPSSGDLGWKFMAGYSLVLVCIVPTFSIFQLLAAGPVQAAVAYQKGETINFSGMFSFAFKKIWHLITASLAYYLVVTLILILTGFGCLVGYKLFPDSLLLQIIVYAGVGLAALAGYIWFAIRALFYLPISLNEKKHFFGAMAKSFQMTEGRFFSLLQLMFTRWLSLLAISVCTQGLISIVSTLLLQNIQEGKAGVGMIIGILLLQLVMLVVQSAESIFLVPITYLTVPIAYLNERNLKYADDLTLKINGLLLRQKNEGIAHADANI